MYVCLHPVLYNSNHKHVGTISCLLEAKDKMKQFTYSVHVTGCLHDTGGNLAPERVHSSSLSWLYICLHDTTTKCHAGVSHPGVSSPQFLYGGDFSLQYEISQRYHANAKRPSVSVWNRSTIRLEQVAHALFVILNHMCILSTWSVPSNNEIWNGPVIM